MAIRTKAPEFAATEVVVAWQNLAAGDDVLIRGTRLRGSHPLVRRYPGSFVRDGTPEREWPPEVDYASMELPEPPREFTVEPSPITEPVVCLVGLQDLATGRVIAKGQILDRSEAIVDQHRAHFARVLPLDDEPA